MSGQAEQERIMAMHDAACDQLGVSRTGPPLVPRAVEPPARQLRRIVGVLPKVAADVVFELDDGSYAIVSDLQLAAWGFR